MQARGADYLGRRVNDNQVDMLFSYRGARMTFMVRGRRTEDVTVSVRRQFDGRRLDVQMMQVADAVVQQCSPQQQDT
jgi:head-tail adaptor